MLKFSDTKVVGTVSVPMEITEEDVENIIVSAFEGGSNYWMGVDNTGKDWDNKPKDEPVSTWAVKLLLEGKSVKLYDKDEEGDEENPEEWTLTLAKLLKGIEINGKARPEQLNRDVWDAETADCFIQCALFGELIYG